MSPVVSLLHTRDVENIVWVTINYNVFVPRKVTVARTC